MPLTRGSDGFLFEHSFVLAGLRELLKTSPARLAVASDVVGYHARCADCDCSSILGYTAAWRCYVAGFPSPHLQKLMVVRAAAAARLCQRAQHRCRAG
jgi:hypothetical protein